MKLEDILGGEITIAGQKYTLVEMKFNGAVIWPTAYTYVIDTSTLVVHYSTGTSILANASNYAYVTADVKVYQGETLKQTLSNQTLTPTALSDTTHFSRDGQNVKGNNLGTTEVANGYSVTVTLAYGNSDTVTATVRQQANTKTQTSTVKTYTGYAITLSSTAFNSAGGSANVTGTATFTTTPVYTWTSGSTSNGTPSSPTTESKAPDTLTVTPDTNVTINAAKTKITFPQNTGSTINYVVNATGNGFSAAPVTVKVNQTVITFGNLQISSYTYPYIPASGGTVRPTISFSLDYYEDDVKKGTMTGSFVNGATSTIATCSATGFQASVSCSYQYKSGNYWYTDSNNGSVSANSLGTTERTYLTEIGTRRVIVSKGSVSTTSGAVTVYQSQNYKSTTYTYSYTGFNLWMSPSSLGSTDTSFMVYGTLSYTSTPHYSYSSGASADGSATSGSTTVTPTITGVSPSASSISGNTVTIPQNSGTTPIEYTVSGKYTDPDGRQWTDSDSITQSAIAYTYGTPSVSISYEEIASGYHIAAAGNTGNPLYPAINFSQLRTPTSGTADYVTGSISGGATSGTASDGSTFTVQYFGTAGTGSVSGGGVTAGSKGTTVSGVTNVATGLYVKITIHSKTGQSSSVIVKQQANAVTSTEETSITYGISGMAIAWAAGGSSAKSAGETGSLSYSSCKKYYYLKSYYTSGDSATASTQSSTDITPTYSADSSKTWVPSVSGSTVTATKRGKNDTSSRSGAVKAYYGSNLLGSLNISQAGTAQTFSLSSNYASGISFTAAGGEVTPTFTGTVSYDNGDSADSTSGVSVTFSSGSDISGRISHSGTKVTGSNLGTTPYGSTSTSYTWYWTAHSGATHTIAVSQGANTASYGTITVTPSSSSVPASGTSSAITFTASCPVSWTSGATSALSTSDFSFSIYSKGNNGKRTYSLSGTSLTLGSLGTNLVSSAQTTTIRASHSGAGTKDTDITEARNIVESNSLSVGWDVHGSPISGSGGTASVGIDSASYNSVYSSGATNSSAVDPQTLLEGLAISGTGFSYNYVTGAERGTITATQNPSTTSARSCTLTASYAGSSATTNVSQSAYVVVVITQAYQLTGWVGEPTFALNQYTLDHYVLDCGGAILKVYFASITSGAANRSYRIRIDALGNGTDYIGSGIMYDSCGCAVPSSSTTQYNAMESSFSFDSGDVEVYSFIRFRISLEGGSGQNLLMSGNYIDLDFTV